MWKELSLLSLLIYFGIIPALHQQDVLFSLKTDRRHCELKFLCCKIKSWLLLSISLCFQSLDGFVFALNKEGRFLYISETVSIYLGLSQVRHSPHASAHSLLSDVTFTEPQEAQSRPVTALCCLSMILVFISLLLSNCPYVCLPLSARLSSIITKDNSQQIKPHFKSHQLVGRLLICAASDDAYFIALCVRVHVCVLGTVHCTLSAW